MRGGARVPAGGGCRSTAHPSLPPFLSLSLMPPKRSSARAYTGAFAPRARSVSSAKKKATTRSPLSLPPPPRLRSLSLSLPLYRARANLPLAALCYPTANPRSLFSHCPSASPGPPPPPRRPPGNGRPLRAGPPCGRPPPGRRGPARRRLCGRAGRPQRWRCRWPGRPQRRPGRSGGSGGRPRQPPPWRGRLRAVLVPQRGRWQRGPRVMAVRGALAGLLRRRRRGQTRRRRRRCPGAYSEEREREVEPRAFFRSRI